MMPSLKKGLVSIRTLLFLLFLLIAAFISCLWIDTSTSSVERSTNKTMVIPAKHNILRNETIEFPLNCAINNELQSKVSVERSTNTTVVISEKHNIPQRETIEFPLNCTINNNQTQTCPTNYPKLTTSRADDQDPPRTVCPNYFRWIHEDLRPWIAAGISRDMVERAQRTAHFHLIIVGGKAYIKKYRESTQTRDTFTIWGILQLLRRYPGKIPDLELMFDTDDRPVIRSSDYHEQNTTGPPPLFRYCGDRWTMDIVFPDWCFWGWPDINIKPWDELSIDIKEGNNGSKWIDREPYAYWKGNPFVAETRKDLLACNVSDQRDWNARLFIQDWIQESQQGYKQSDLARQCAHRYKIYIEGYAWSVSEKYILACNSLSLLVKPYYHDFFTRSLQPLQHYWPIRDTDKCKSIKFAVDWGNKNNQKAQEIGKAASDFIQEELKMDYVYDYMFHLLNEYAKLLKFAPRVPEEAVEMCSEIMACPADGLEKKFMTESLVKSPRITRPCTLPPAYEPHVLGAFYRKKLNTLRRVQKWEDGYWKEFNKQHQQNSESHL
eukprot:XP_015571642.1 O-glucosyltransferase rumi homolog isoform X1 [Ricinus communis]